jgi:hypothetical protein
VHTYYTSPEYPDEATPDGEAAVMICRDDDGPRLLIMSGERVIVNLPLPPCEGMVIGYVLDLSARDTLHANEHEQVADVQHIAPQLAPPAATTVLPPAYPPPSYPPPSAMRQPRALP